MQIDKIKSFKKVENGETINHVVIHYTEGNKSITLHSCEKARPEFYKLFKECSAHTCKIGEFSDHEIDRTIITGVSIKYDEDKDGNDVIGVVFTARRKLVASRNPIIFNTPIKFSEHKDPNQKLATDAWATVEALTAEAEEYIEGKRERIDFEIDKDEIEKAEAVAAHPAEDQADDTVDQDEIENDIESEQANTEKEMAE